MLVILISIALCSSWRSTPVRELKEEFLFRYPNNNELPQQLAALQASYPHLLHIKSIGKSASGAWDIWSIELGVEVRCFAFFFLFA
jgi:hypothetical protein